MMKQGIYKILYNFELAPTVFRMVLEGDTSAFLSPGQFVNVKIYIYGILSMEAYILPYYSGNMPALLFFALLLAIIGFIFTLVWTAFGAAFRKIFSRHARTVNTILALLLVYCAVSLFIS